MKKNLILTICILFCWAVQAQKLDTISFSIDKVELCEVNGYTRVSMLSCKTTAELGSPELPYLELSYILPYDSKISSISIIDSTKVLLFNNVVIYPKQPEYPMDDTIQHDFLAPNREIYDSRIDGGSTATEVSEINNATSSDMWKLRARLLGYSPYVSNEVLTSTIDRDDVFTGSVLFEILAANPDELKRDTLINYIESKNNRLPDYMINILRDIAYGNTARTALTSQITHYAHERAMAAGDIIRSDLNDTVIDLAELRLWLGRMNDLASDRMVVSTYVHEGDFSSAMALANTFPTVYNLQGGDLLDHYDYMMLLDLYRTLYNSGRNVFELTEDEMNVVTDIADNGYGTSRLMAESILIEISDRGTISYYCPNLVLEMPDRGITSYSYNPTEESDSFIVKVSPVPATTWAVVDYVLPNKENKALMTIVSSLGVKAMVIELNGAQGTKTLDLHDLAAGVYGYSVRSGDYQKAGRIIITK